MAVKSDAAKDGRRRTLVELALRLESWERLAESASTPLWFSHFLADVFLRPVVGRLGGWVVSALFGLIIWLTIVWSDSAGDRAKEAGDAAIAPETGVATVLIIAVLALLAGWAQVFESWRDTLRSMRWRDMRSLRWSDLSRAPARRDAAVDRKAERAKAWEALRQWRDAQRVGDSGAPGRGESAQEGRDAPPPPSVFAKARALLAGLFGAPWRGVVILSWLPAVVVSFVDWFFARVLAAVAGAHLGGWFWRYVWFFGVIGGAIWLGLVARPGALEALGLPSYTALGVLVVAILLVIGVARRWAWVEADREALLIARAPEDADKRKLDRSLRLGFREDLRDEAITGLVALFALIPLGLMQVELIYPGSFAFKSADAAAALRPFGLDLAAYFGVTATRGDLFGPLRADNALWWLGFFGAELSKAVPFVDWSEVFHVPNGSPIEPKEGFGAAMVFALRAGLDLLVLAAVLQAFSVVGRMLQVRAAFDAGRIDVLDPFDLARFFRRAAAARLPFDSLREVDQPGVARFTLNAAQLFDIAEGKRSTRGGRAAEMAAMAVAARLLAAGERKVVDCLATRLADDRSPEVQAQAIRLMGEIGPLSAAEKSRFAQACAEQLRKRGADARVKIAAARELGRLGAVDQADVVDQTFDGALAGAAAVALAKLGHPSAETRLAALPQEGTLGAMRRHGLDLLHGTAELKLPAMARIPAGEFMMGSPETEKGRFAAEGPQHLRAIGQFKLGRYAVAFDEYDAFAEATGRDKPSDEGWGRGRGRQPAINLSWFDAAAYAAWLSEVTGERWRLPSEAEWEYACREGGEAKGAYYFDDAMTVGDLTPEHANFGRNIRRTVPVDAREPFPKAREHKFGLLHMHGNVWEWCADAWNNTYQDAPTDGAAWLFGDTSLAVLRGGSWVSYAHGLRSAFRSRTHRRYDRIDGIGFRVARTAVE